MTCKGLCTRYRNTVPFYEGRYRKGQRRCQHCAEFIVWDGLYCPCCGYRLRLKPRNPKARGKYLRVMS